VSYEEQRVRAETEATLQTEQFDLKKLFDEVKQQTLTVF